MDLGAIYILSAVEQLTRRRGSYCSKVDIIYRHIHKNHIHTRVPWTRAHIVY